MSDQVYRILEFYRLVQEDLLAVPVIKGYKSEEEKFPGGDSTTTVECFIPGSNRSLQGATSHMLGQNFAKMFNIQQQGVDSTKKYVWQTSWGLSTRSLGAMIMIHSDDKGLVLPPKVAKFKIVIVPIIIKNECNNII